MNSAVLITYDQDDMIDEAVALCESADYKVKHIIKQNFLKKPKYGLSGGKIEDLKEIISTVKPDVVVFDEILKPSQNYNLASELKMEILDREALILQIFEKRSSSAESKLQVKLAQARYDMSRAKEKVRLSKKGEQPGFMGLGTFEVDVYYNEIKKRMINIKSKLVKSGKQRKLHREARKRLGFKTISLAGYTSAGKTTLFNALTGEQQEKTEIFNKILSSDIFLQRETDPLIHIVKNFVSKNNNKVLITGNGGDEIYNDYIDQDYGYKRGRSNGKFPDNLSLIWPWHNHRPRLLNANSRFDIITGYFGAETRNPLLDRNLVQAWLNTSSKLKNKNYKDWMEIYLKEANYPYTLNKIHWNEPIHPKPDWAIKPTNATWCGGGGGW